MRDTIRESNFKFEEICGTSEISRDLQGCLGPALNDMTGFGGTP